MVGTWAQLRCAELFRPPWSSLGLQLTDANILGWLVQGVKASRGPGFFGVPIRGFPQPLAPWDPPGGSLFLRWPSLPQPPSWASGSCPDRPRPCRFLPIVFPGSPWKKIHFGSWVPGCCPQRTVEDEQSAGFWAVDSSPGPSSW